MARLFSNRKLAYIFLIPQLMITFIFFIWPAIGAIVQSLLYSDAFGLHHYFAGFDNYLDLFKSDEYLHAIFVTILISVSVTFLTMFFGLSMAVLVTNRSKSQKIYKTLLLWPYAVAPAVAAILWRFLFHPSLGWITGFFEYFGYHFNYLISAPQALMVVIIASSWQQFSYNFLFFFAALKLIPKELTEAAIIDGASSWRRFWQIKFPLLSPTLFFLLIMNMIYSVFDTFGVIQVMTNGGPEYSTTTLIFKVYKDGFVGMDLGSSSAQSVILMIIVIGLTMFQFQYLDKRVHYQ